MNLSEIKRTPLWVLVIPLVLYVNTLFNGYVLYDAGLLIDNSRTEQGLNSVANIFTSGYRATLQTLDKEFYRPFPKLFFAVYWWISPGNPIIPHAVNLVLFCLICAALFHILVRTFQIKQEAAALSVLFIRNIKTNSTIVFACICYAVTVPPSSSLFITGKICVAEQKFKQALTIAPHDARANSNLGSVYGTMARNAMQAGDTLAFTQLLDSALSRYTQAIRYDASFPDAYEYASVI